MILSYEVVYFVSLGCRIWWVLRQNLSVFVRAMKPKSRGLEQDDLLRRRLTDMIAMRHELVK